MSRLLARQSQIRDEESQSITSHSSHLSALTDDHEKETRPGTPNLTLDLFQATVKKDSFEVGWDGSDDPENPQVCISAINLFDLR